MVRHVVPNREDHPGATDKEWQIAMDVIRVARGRHWPGATLRVLAERHLMADRPWALEDRDGNPSTLHEDIHEARTVYLTPAAYRIVCDAAQRAER